MSLNLSEVRWGLTRTLVDIYLGVSDDYLPRPIMVSKAGTAKEVARDVYADWRVKGSERTIQSVAKNFGVEYRYIKRQARGLFLAALRGE